MTSNLPETVSEAWQMICPECRRDDNIRIYATIAVILTPMGTDPTDSDTVWDNASNAYCDQCGFNGILQDFRDAFNSRRDGGP